ncbi:MAG: serine hydrolase [Acidobacteriota bacterium]
MTFRLIRAVCVVLVCSSSFVLAQTVSAKHYPEDKKLAALLAPLVKKFHGDAGIYVRNLKTGRSVAINADTVFPTASMIKVTIMCGLFDKIERGELAYHQELLYRDSLLYPGADILGSFKDSAKIPLSEVAMLMITTSDNTASLWCQSMAGTGTAINALLEKNGFEKTRVNSRTPGREVARSLYGWGQTTPREMAELFVMIRDGRMISREASERMYRNLCRIYWDGEALSQIPPTIHAASKQGAVDRSKSETVLVNAPSGDYVFSVITKNQQDERWEYDNEGYVLLREVSRLLWRYYEPASKWTPGANPQKWQ